ncbi:hypothetical protein [Sphingobium yanoikuyae]|jgi:hypothetical protein|nr:hypothetical protein [Sphingobium yanoikuyae]
MTLVRSAHKFLVHRMLQNLKRHLDDADAIREPESDSLLATTEMGC